MQIDKSMDAQATKCSPKGTGSLVRYWPDRQVLHENVYGYVRIDCLGAVSNSQLTHFSVTSWARNSGIESINLTINCHGFDIP